MKHINDGSGQADRLGVREQLEAAIAEAEGRMAAADPDSFEYDAAFEDACDAWLKLEQLNQAEFGLEMHQVKVTEVGPNIDPSEVENEEGELAYFCYGSTVMDWQILVACSGFEIGERVYMQKHRADVLEKAALSFLEWLTGERAPTWPYGFETEVIQLAGETA